VSDALDCYWTNGCQYDFPVRFLYLEANEDWTNLNCTVPLTPTASSLPSTDSSSPPHTVAPCPNLPIVDHNDKPIPMPSPDIELPSSLPKACFAPETHMGQGSQCSLFMNSQLRAFSGYRQGLETCSIPGKWYMLQHPSLSIEVEGTNMTGPDSGPTHTRLSKITVSISPSDCDPVRRTYVAQRSLPLPSQLLPPPSPGADTSNPIPLVCGANGTVVTLLVPWLNTAIVIRQYANFLSITIKVPSQMAHESQGLCKGCPAQMYVNITQFNNQFLSRCLDAKNRATVGCYARGGVVQKKHLSEVTNNTYFDVCLFNMYKIATLDVLTMLSAVTDDAKTITTLPEAPSDSTTSTRLPTLSSSYGGTPTTSSDAQFFNSISLSRPLRSCTELVVLSAFFLFLFLR